ncbi:transcriptional regulator [uncultured Aquimarina sp.]|uniref:helix-turn-helix domain-containing protein n=1 Tax=uncultured Aquimarina sp. TaxID=575652 RepID=UPI002636997E|nr:transcriptional regulator [uncultured Aquimarina sp.]
MRKVSNYKPINSKIEYENALNRIEDIFISSSPEEIEELEILSILVEKYEEENFLIEDPDPIDAILFVMEQNNMTKKDLGDIINSKSRVSEILYRKRALSINHIRSINKHLKIPADILIKEYKLS